MKCFFSLGLLMAVSVAQAQTTPPTPSNEPKTPKSLTRLLIDRDELRSIEVVTNRHESVSQLFARRRIALATVSLLNNKSVNSWSQLRISKPTPAFVSYPLHNDNGFQIKFYGHQLELMPPAPAVLNLFKNALVRGEYRDFVVLAFDDDVSSEALTEKTRRAHLIGRVQVFGNWRPESEKALLAFSPPSH